MYVQDDSGASARNIQYCHSARNAVESQNPAVHSTARSYDGAQDDGSVFCDPAVQINKYQTGNICR